MSLSKSQRVETVSKIKPAIENDVIVQGTEEDVFFSESSNEKTNEYEDSLDAHSQTSKKLFEKNLKECNMLRKQNSLKKSHGSTANSYVWIKERRHTTFTGLTFEQRQRGLNRRSNTMVMKD